MIVIVNMQVDPGPAVVDRRHRHHCSKIGLQRGIEFFDAKFPHIVIEGEISSQAQQCQTTRESPSELPAQ